MRLNLTLSFTFPKSWATKGWRDQNFRSQRFWPDVALWFKLGMDFPLPASWFLYQSVCNWRRMRSFCNIPTWPKNTGMLQLGSAEFHKDIEKLSEEAQLIWNLSKCGCVVNVFCNFLGDWNKHRRKTVRAELAFRSVEKVGQFVIWCVCVFEEQLTDPSKQKTAPTETITRKLVQQTGAFFYEVIVGSVSK